MERKIRQEPELNIVSKREAEERRRKREERERKLAEETKQEEKNV